MEHKILHEADLIAFVRHLLEENIKLRDTFCAGHKFNFISDRLASLLRRLETEIECTVEIKGEVVYQPASDETVVYVHLFNTQGLNIKQWLNMLKASSFYEYSVNRPIYGERTYVDALLRTKKIKIEHGFVEMAVNKNDVMPQKIASTDDNKNPVLKLREGSLKIDKVISFLHNDITYRLTEKGLEIKT